MRALRYHESGDPTVLQVDDIERPTLNPGEILVEVRAASINPTDAKRRQWGTGPLPKTSGSDFAGVVDTVGSDVTEYQVGDRVCGTGLHTTRFQQGAFADYIAVPTDIVTRLPNSVSFEDGAAIALVGVTAWRGLLDHGGLEPTDSCLVHGGTGGVGHVAVQLSNQICAHTTTSAHPERKQIAKKFGAESVVDYDRDGLATLPDDEFDVVFDHRTPYHFTYNLEVAAFDADIVYYAGLEGKVALERAFMTKNLSVHAMTMSNLVTESELPSLASVLERVLDMVDQGAITPEIARTYSFEDATEAHRAILEDSFVGKVVLIP